MRTNRPNQVQLLSAGFDIAFCAIGVGAARTKDPVRMLRPRGPASSFEGIPWYCQHLCPSTLPVRMKTESQ
jgi:hypothetical protein